MRQRTIVVAAFTILAACGRHDPEAPCSDCMTVSQHALVSTINPVADAYVRDGASAGSNFGTATQLVVKRQTSTGNTRWSYLRFSLSTVTGPVTVAKLRLYGNRPTANPATDSVFAVASNTWTETGITWNNKPAPGAQQGPGVVVGTTAQYFEWDVTAFVAAQKAAAATHVSLAVQMDSDVIISPDTFNSREASSNKPELLVTHNHSPTVAITSPANGASFTAPASFTVNATASAAAGGTVVRVELRRNGQLVGSDTTAPYSWSLSNLPAGAHLLDATVVDNEGATGVSQIAVAVNAPPTGTVFVQDGDFDGVVSIEVENFASKLPQGGHDWTAVSQSGSSGGALQATPNNGANVNTGYTTGSPRLDYPVHFRTTGRHYIWMRARGPTTSDDSYHAGLDGQALASCDRIGNFSTTLGWRKLDLDGGKAHFDVAEAGQHTVNVWMREDGLIIDKILITPNAHYVPSGTGPAESPRTTGNLPPVAEAGASRFALSGRPVTLDGTQSYDVDGLPAELTFAWSQLSGPPVTLTAATTGLPSFTPPAAGSYRFQLIVSDGQFTSRDTVTITVNASAQGPALLSETFAFHDATAVSIDNFPFGLHDGVLDWPALKNNSDVAVSVTFMFNKPMKVVGAAGVFGGTGVWTVEAAANLSDLNSGSGSYRKLVDREPQVPNDWSRRAFAEVSQQVFRFTNDRSDGGGFVEIRELELTLANRWDMVRLESARGVAVNGANQKLIADSFTQRVVVFDDKGDFVGEFGQSHLGAPHDVAVDPYGNILVSDLGASAIVKFDPGGNFIGQLAGSGQAPGQLQAPAGIAVDDRGRILVTELDNHRVQRLLPDGTPDPSFGSGGVLGTGVVTRSNAGFDLPTDVVWDAPRRRVVVADKGASNDPPGNNRIQIFSESGSYLHTVSAVYDVQSVAIDPAGTIYAGGGTAFINNGTLGALRIIPHGDEFVRSYYRNGAAGLGYMCTGLAWDNEGRLVITDDERRTFHTFEPGQQGDIYDVSTKTGPDWMEISYKTQLPGPTAVHWGANRLEASAVDPTPTQEHTIRIGGLQPSAQYLMAPVYPRSRDGASQLAPYEMVGTEPAQAGRMNVRRLRVAGIMYTANMSDGQKQRFSDSYGWVEEFYFRNSHGRLWLDMNVITRTEALTAADMDGVYGPKASVVEAHLAAAGVSGPLDLVVVTHNGPVGGNYGGMATFFDREAGYARFSTDSPFVMIHEVSHSMDSIFHAGGQPRYDFNHGLWFIDPQIKGLDGTINGELIRKLSAANILGLRAPWGVRHEVSDADGDGVSDDSTLPVNESSLGGNPSSPDSDGDGLTDLQEMERGIFRGASPADDDTDGDAATQGNDLRDRNPLLPMNGYVGRATPTIDGEFTPEDGWTPVMIDVNFQNPFSVHSINNSQDVQQHLNTKIWAAWDDGAVYFAVEFLDRGSPHRDKLHLRFDLSDRGWHQGLDKHHLEFEGGLLRANRIHGITQDVSSILGGGQWSEIYDDSEAWTLPANLNLAPLFDRSQLVTNIRSLPNDRYYVEIKIPAGARRAFTPIAEKVINFIAYHETAHDTWDHLMEFDTGARLMLVEPVDTDGDGVWDQQEFDIGRDPLVPQ